MDRCKICAPDPFLWILSGISEQARHSEAKDTKEGLEKIFTVAFDFLSTSNKTYLQLTAIIDLARAVMIRACRSCKHYCMHFTETMVFAMMPQDSQYVNTSAFPGSQDLKGHRAWGVFTQLQTIKNAKRQLITSSLTLPAEEYQDGHTKPPTASPTFCTREGS